MAARFLSWTNISLIYTLGICFADLHLLGELGGEVEVFGRGGGLGLVLQLQYQAIGSTHHAHREITNPNTRFRRAWDFLLTS